MRSVGVMMLAVATMLSGCAMTGEVMDATESTEAIDAAGLTLSHVESLSLEEQFDLLEQRTEHLQGLLTDAQEQISTEVWSWGKKGLMPLSGLEAPGAVDGATEDNSYFLAARRTIEPPGAVGARSDLDPMLAYFESKGWQTTITELSGDRFWLKANTGDGYWVAYTVQPNGQYNMEAYSEMFWGDYPGLLRAVGYRVTPESTDIEESVPGVFVPFPKWSDPVRER